MFCWWHHFPQLDTHKKTICYLFEIVPISNQICMFVVFYCVKSACLPVRVLFGNFWLPIQSLNVTHEGSYSLNTTPEATECFVEKLPNSFSLQVFIFQLDHPKISKAINLHFKKNVLNFERIKTWNHELYNNRHFFTLCDF